MKLKHSTGGRQIDVAPQHVSMYESQGWVRVSAPTTTKRTARPRAGSSAAAGSDTTLTGASK